MPYAAFDNNRYYYIEKAPAKPRAAIVFVHGAGGSHSHWAGQIAELGRYFRVIALDLPGHGHSQGQSMDSIAAYGEFIRKFTDFVLPGDFYLAGHSMGGAITLEFACAGKGRLAGLILIGTGARLKVHPDILAAFKNGGHFRELVEMSYGENAAPGLKEKAAREMEQVAPLTYYHDFLACDRFDIMERLSRISVPALILAGGKDRLTPPKYGKYLYEQLPAARFTEIENAGHMMMLENPAAVNASITSFIYGFA